MTYKVSVLIPCYNGERFIEDCIRSLQNGSCQNIEIVIVNDGSTDNTEKICKRLAEQDERIKYIYQENAGVSAARNLALTYATGEYVVFCDSDDLMPTDAIQVLLSLVTEQNCDMASGLICYQKSNMQEVCRKQTGDVRVLDKKEQVIFRCIDTNYDSVCGKIFKRSFLNGVTFEVGRKINEDIYFIFLCLAKCNRLAELDYMTYKTLYHNESASRTSFDDKHYDILYFKDKKMHYLEQHFPALHKLRAAVALRHLIGFFIKFIRSDASKEEKKKIKKEIWANRKGISICSKREEILFVAICFFYPIFNFRYNRKRM